MPNAVPDGSCGTGNLEPLGEAAKSVLLELSADKASGMPNERAPAAVNSLGPLDLIEVVASGLAPKSQYRVYIADSHQAP